MTSAILVRIVLFALAWIALAGTGPAVLAVGVVAVPAAAAVSLRLMPAGPGVAWSTLPAFLLRFVRGSLVAGTDVARRALDPALPVEPGFVIHRPTLAPGRGREAWLTVASLQPGTLPVATGNDGTLLFHALDARSDAAAAIAADEAAFARLVVRSRRDG